MVATLKCIAKEKGKKVVQEAEILKDTSKIRVTQSQVKHSQMDSGDQGNTKTLASSSLIEMSTLKVKDMSLSVTWKSVANSTIMRRVTHSKTCKLFRPFTNSPLAHIDLEAKDTPPSTPLAGQKLDSDQETPEDHREHDIADPSVSIMIVPPSTQGKGKLDTSWMKGSLN